MKKRTIAGVIALALVCTLIGTGIGMQQSILASAESTAVVVTSPFTAAVAAVRDSVVGVSNYQMVRYGNGNYGYGFGFGFGYGNGSGRNGGNSYTEQEVLYATGSGVVVAEGYVLTNYHVVEDATSLKVTTSDESYSAVVVAKDENLDVAVLYAPDLSLSPVSLGDSDTLQVGDWAICIGNPLSSSFSGTVTAGIISGLDRAISSTSTDRYGRRETITNTMIQTDAAINSGNSGGGMFNVAGELMGIPTMKYSGSAYSSSATVEGIGLCIPINAAKPVIEEALAGSHSRDELPQSSSDTNAATGGLNMTGKPRLGITISSVNTSSYVFTSGILPQGVYVVSVEENGPADKAGMQADDIIVEVDGTIVNTVSALQQYISQKQEGDVINVKVYRVPGLADATDYSQIADGEYIDLQVTLAVVDAVVQ